MSNRGEHGVRLRKSSDDEMRRADRDEAASMWASRATSHAYVLGLSVKIQVWQKAKVLAFLGFYRSDPVHEAASGLHSAPQVLQVTDRSGQPGQGPKGQREAQNSQERLNLLDPTISRPYPN